MVFSMKYIGAMAILLLTVCPHARAQTTSVKDCEGVLKATDYSAYALQNNLELSFRLTQMGGPTTATWLWL
jgi:hypothetical protein